MRAVLLGNHQASYSSESHYALSLEALGHEVVRLQEGRATAADILAESSHANMLVWIHTHGWGTSGRMDSVLDDLRRRKIPSLAYHLDLFKGIPERWAEYQKNSYINKLDYFFSVDGPMVDWLNANTKVKAHYLPPGVLEAECYMAEPSDKTYDVVFVGSRAYHHGWPYRGQLVAWLEHTYGERFRMFGQNSGKVIRGKELNQVYADAKVVIGDSYCPNFTYPNYYSDRIPETLGRGGFLIHPRIKGIEDDYVDDKHLILYDFNDFTGLKAIIDHYLRSPAQRDKIRKAAHLHVKANHTYTRRWEHIIATVFGEELPLTPPARPSNKSRSIAQTTVWPPAQRIKPATPEARWTVRDANEIQHILDRHRVSYVHQGQAVIDLARYVEKVRQRAKET